MASGMTSSLYEAIVNNDIEKMYSLYTDDRMWEKFNPSQNCEEGDVSFIPLHLACSYARYEIANYFINSQFCNINCCDSKRRNMLHKLNQPHRNYSEEDREKIAKLLLQKNCDINAQDIEGNTPIHTAIYNHDLNMLKILLEKKERIKVVKNNDGDTPLHIACTAGLSRFIRKEVVTRLIEVSPLYVDARNNKGYTPLFVACTSNHSYYLEKLTSLGNKLQRRTPLNNYTLLHLAVHADKLCIVEWLMKQYDSQWFQYCIDTSGKTPIHLAKSKECLAALLSGGYDVNLPDSYGNTLLHEVAAQSNFSSSPFKKIELLKYLLDLDGCEINQQNKALQTPLHLAVQHGDVCVVELFLKCTRCDVKAQNSTGQTILHLAVKSKNTELIKSLSSEERIDIESTDNDQETAVHLATAASSEDVLTCFKNYTGSFNNEGQNPLHVAVCRRELSIIKHIISIANPDLSIQTEQGDTLLHLAAKHNKLEILDFLLSQKSLDINATNQNLDTCLHVAVTHSRLEIIDFLLHHKSCNINLVNIYGLSPFSMAAHRRNLEAMRRIISNKNPDFYPTACTRQNDTCLHLAAQCNSISMLKHFVDLGFDINAVNSNLETPLSIAVKYCNIAAVEYIGKLDGCKLDVRNGDGNSPLHVAVLSNNIECVKTLVSLQCDMNLRNHDHLTPLHIAVKEGRSEEMLRYLTSSRNCDPSIRTKDDDNILHLAAYAKSTAIFRHIDSEMCKLLINSKNKAGNFPLHVAVAISNLEFVICTLSLSYAEMSPLNSADLTPLHMAIKLQDIAVIKAFIQAKEGDTLLSNTKFNALHHAAKEGNAEIFQFLLSLKTFDINSKNLVGQTPLHIAISCASFNIAEIIIKTKQCELAVPDKDGNTPLHLVCMLEGNQQESLKIAKLLLRKCKVSCTYSTNQDRKTPPELVKDNYKLLHTMFQNVADVTARNPLENVMKIVVIGKSGVGKSSLIQAIATEAKYSIWKKKRQFVTPISRQTAGIETREFFSKKFGCTAFYELAGQLEYYNSNAAILKNLISHSPPVFVIVVNLSNSDDDILDDLVYWWRFITTPCQETTGISAHTIVALSHLDVFKKKGRQIAIFKDWLLREIEERFPSPNFNFNQAVSFLDCRRLLSRGLTNLQSYLNESCSSLRVNLDVHVACHYLIAFLRNHFKDNLAIQLVDIQAQIQEDSFIQRDPEELLKLLETLHHQDKVLLLKNPAKVEDSWIVLQKDTLLSEVTGGIFSPEKFQKHIACSTGVVPFENIKIYFKKYDPVMLIGFFKHLEFCSLIEDPKAYSLIQNDCPSLTDDSAEFYFFPNLIRKTCPCVEEVWKTLTPENQVKYGWFYKADKYELQTRFLQVLILRIAFQFALKDLNNVETPVLNRRCSVWKNGIAWLKHGFQIVVEVGLQKNWVSVIIRCENAANVKVQCAHVLSELTQTIRETRKEFCPSINMLEYFIAPEHVDYPMEAKLSDEQDGVLYEIGDAVESVLESSTGYVTDRSGHCNTQLCSLVPFEPLIYCGKNLITKIFSAFPNEQTLRQIKNEIILHSKSHNVQIHLIEHFFLKDGFCSDHTSPHQFADSIAKCSILSHKFSLCVLKKNTMTEVDIDSRNHETTPLNSLHSQLSGLKVKQEDLYEVAAKLSVVVHEWINIGVLLGNPMETLKRINAEFTSSDVCLYNMLSDYFNRDEKDSWSILIAATYQFNKLAAKELLYLCNPNLNSEALFEVIDYPSTDWVPNLKDSFMALIPLASHWQQIAVNLRIPQQYIHSICHDYTNSCDQLREMLYVMQTQILNTNFTWYSLAHAVERIDPGISHQLKKKGIIRFEANDSSTASVGESCFLQLSEHHITVLPKLVVGEFPSIKWSYREITRVAYDPHQDLLTLQIQGKSYSFVLCHNKLDSFSKIFDKYFNSS